MGMLVLVALQAVALAGPPVPLSLKLTKPCPSADAAPEEVVVCARPGEAERYRLKPLSPRAERLALPKAETRIFGNAKLTGETEAASVGGFVSDRAMVRIKVPF